MVFLGKKSGVTIRKVISYVLIVFFVIAFFTPLYWMISSSFKMPRDILAIPPKIIFKPTIDNYKQVLMKSSIVNFKRALLNSIIVAFSTTFIALLVSIPAAYTFSRYKFKGKSIIIWYILFTRMLPQFGILIPSYIMFCKLGIFNTYAALILINLSFTLTFSVLMLNGFFKEIPRELEEAAQIDGCTRIQAIFKIIFPLAGPGMAATSIFLVILSWNEFLYALILSGIKTRTAAVAIYGYIGFREVVWGQLTAAGTLTIFPIVVFFLIVQRNFVRGMTMGAIK